MRGDTGWASARARGSAAGVLALALIGGIVVEAAEPSSPARRSGKGDVRIARNAARDETRRLELLDQLDDARINRELLEMEVAADKAQIQKMMTILKETELQAIQGFSNGPVLSGSSPEEREATLKRYKHLLDQTCTHFVIKSKELGRERRRVVDLEEDLGVAAASVLPVPQPQAAPARTGRTWDDAGRVLDLIRRGLETWQGGSAPRDREREEDRSRPAPAPADRSWRDPERLLDLIRKGIEAWQRDSSNPPRERSAPTPPPVPAPDPAPEPSSPEELGLRDADRLLDLLRRGIETWQRQ